MPARARASPTLPGATLPQRIPGNATLANFICLIPRAALGRAQVDPARGRRCTGTACSAAPARSRRGNIKAMANEHNFVFCATDWIGMSTQDLAERRRDPGDLSNFSSLADRAQQGFLNFMYLGRLMIHPTGFSADPAFQFDKSGGRSP